MTPAVSVIVPSRGGAARLPVLLACLEEQSHRDWEVVVVLDGDIDGSETVLARWTDRVPVRTVVFPENRGRPAALNAGHEAARGDVLVRCDDDLAPGRNYVEDHAKAHAAGTVGVVGLCCNLYPETTYARVYGRPAYGRFRAGAYSAAPEVRWRYWGGNVSVDRDTWRLVGPYDEAYRGYGFEDVDWGYRAHVSGVPITILPELETDHHVAATTTAGRSVRAYYAGSASRRFELKHGVTLHGALPRTPWGLAVTGTARLLTEASVAWLGRFVDRVADRLPPAVATKAVALLVEAGSAAGHRRTDAGRAI
jgi:glycosyltransferase involved in cell wall biosynthesis